MRKWLMLCACGALTVCPLAAAEPGRPSESTAALTEDKRLVDRADERVSVLSNGLTLIIKVHRTAPTVSVRMYCKTGSLYEQEYLGSGISHLFEHLLHGGATSTRGEEESSRLLNEIGGNTNAYTTFEATCYYIDTSRDFLPQAANLLADWITHPTFPDGPFTREREVVQRELERDADNPDTQLSYLTLETMFRDHPAQFPIIGHQAIVQKLSKADIVGYHQRMYVPDNIVVCVVGDVEPDRVTSIVSREFASFERKRTPTIVLPEVPEISTPRSALKRMRSAESAILRLAWPSIPLTHPDLYALDVLSYVLTQGDSSRLARTIRDAGLTFSIDSSSWTPSWGKGVFSITARLDPEKVAEATTAILQQIDTLRKEPVTGEELEQAKRQKASEHVFGSQTASHIAERLAWDYLSTGDVFFSDAYVENIQKVTPDQIRDMVVKYLQPQRLCTISILPQSEQAADTRPAEAAAAPAIRMVTLENGLRCLIRSDPTTPLVSMQSFSLGGVYAEDENTNGLSRLAALLAVRGTQRRSAQEIARFFDSRGGEISGASGNNSIYFQAQVLKADFEGAIEVFADVICNPSFPEEELQAYRPRLLDAISRINESWRSELMAFFDSRFFKFSPYRLPAEGSAGVVRKATRQEVAAFYRSLVSGANTVVAVFGDVDAVRAEQLLRQHFATMPRGQKLVRDIPPEPAIPEPLLYVRNKPGQRKVAGVAVGFRGLKLEDTRDAVPLAVLDTVISGYRYPTGWLFDSLRGGDRSLVYEVHAISRPGITPGYFLVYAACQPEQASTVHRIISEQLGKARAGRFTEEELGRAKTIIRTTELMERQTNSELAMQAALDELYGLGYGYRAGFVEQIDKVTIDDLKQVATRYLTTPVVAVIAPGADKLDLGIKITAVDKE